VTGQAPGMAAASTTMEGAALNTATEGTVETTEGTVEGPVDGTAEEDTVEW